MDGVLGVTVSEESTVGGFEPFSANFGESCLGIDASVSSDTPFTFFTASVTFETLSDFDDSLPVEQKIYNLFI